MGGLYSSEWAAASRVHPFGSVCLRTCASSWYSLLLSICQIGKAIHADGSVATVRLCSRLLPARHLFNRGMSHFFRGRSRIVEALRLSDRKFNAGKERPTTRYSGGITIPRSERRRANCGQ
jgi:hypothetical protein